MRDGRVRPPRLCDYAKWSPRNVTGGTFGVDVRHWQRSGLLSTGTSFLAHWLVEPAGLASLLVSVEAADRVRLYYRVRFALRRWETIELPIELSWTSCNYGGQRVWFRCPGADCRRRVAMLYLGGWKPGAFACRRCSRLSYRSECGGPRRRLLQKALSIRRRLGGSESLLEPFPDKPKGMRWKRYERLRQQAAQAELQSWPDPHID